MRYFAVVLSAFCCLVLGACKSPYRSILSGFTQDLGTRPFKIQVMIEDIPGQSTLHTAAEKVIKDHFSDLLVVAPDSKLELYITGTDSINDVQSIDMAVQSVVIHPVKTGTEDTHAAVGEFVWSERGRLFRGDISQHETEIEDQYHAVLSEFREKVDKFKTGTDAPPSSKYQWIKTLQAAAAVLGCGLIYIGAFFRKDDQGKVQDIFQELWVRVESANARGLKLMSETSILTLAAINRILGPKSFSLQGLAAGALYAGVSLAVADVGLLSWFYTMGETPPLFLAIRAVIVLPLAMLLLALPFLLSERVWRLFTLIFAPLLLIYFSISIWLIVPALVDEPGNHALVAWFRVVLFLMVFVGISVQLLYVSGIKRLLANNSESAKSGSIAAMVSIMTLYFVIWAIPFALFVFDRGDLILLPNKMLEAVLDGLAAFGTTQLIGCVGSAIFLSLLLAIALHRLFLPVLDRIIYAVEEFELVKKRKILIAGGAMLIGLAFPPVQAAIERLLSIAA